VSPNVNVATTSIIRGPCLIENDVIIDDFCKIIGPTYIGSCSFIGMSSFVRKSVLGCNTRIGFNCEIGRSFFEGHDMIAHQNVILDSIIGEDVWFGGYSGTVNVTDDRKNVRYQIGEVDGYRHGSFRSSNRKSLCNRGIRNYFAGEADSAKYGNSGWNCYRQERNCVIFIEGEII